MKHYIANKKTKNRTLEDDPQLGNLAEYFELDWEYCEPLVKGKKII